MIKIAGLALITITCAGIGFLLADRYKKRVTELQNYLTFLNSVESEIRYNAFEIGRIIENAVKSSEKSNFAENILKSPEHNIIAKWKTASVSGKNHAILSENDKQLFLYFADFIGTTDAEGQLNSLLYLKDRVKSSLEDAKGEYSKKGNLYRQLFLFCGIGISIILI